ncbi:hypothetical protein [Gordonia sp. (in: high G+C Gram-positive bacteria)]|uniref:hypothetical protein n=1 Tax=Gordonia sp. (in: high G+C Gram-positive bacteria) TaxID=84139 RepID=UPI003340DA66
MIGGDAGPGPGTGNGTPIVGGRPTDQNRTGRTGGPTGPRTPAPATVTPNRPGQPSDNGQTPGRTQAPAGVPVKQSEQSPSDQAFLSPASDDDGGSIPLPVWAIAGAAAVAAASPRARSLLSRGGSTRGKIGSSDLVLIHDRTSPDRYVFDENVPPGGHIRINSDGSATVLDADGKVVKQIGRPWAFDAAGRPQKTWYEVDENGNLVQVVEPADNALYPILADPPGDTGGGLIAPTTGDNGADISAMPDTTGKQPGDTWTETRGGQDVQFTIPEGNGNQSVEMAYKGNDGQDATALIVSDGEGGYQAWSQSADGSGQYIDKDGPQAPGYSQWYRTGNDPAYNSPNQITDANYNFTEGTTYDLDNGSVTQAQLQPDNTYLNRTEYQTGEVDTAVNTPNGDGSYDQTQTSHLDADGENEWELRDGQKWTIERTEDEFGRPLVQYENPKTGESEIDFHDEDGNRRIQTFNSAGDVVFQRFYTDDGYNEITYDSTGRQTGAAFYDSEGKLLAGTVDLGDKYAYRHLDGSSTIEMKSPTSDGIAMQHIGIDGTVTNLTGDGHFSRSEPGQAAPMDWTWGTSNTAAATIDAQTALTEQGIRKVPGGALSAGDSKILGGLKSFGLLGGVAIGTIADSQTMDPSRAFMTNAIGGTTGLIVGETAGAWLGTFIMPGVGTAVGWAIGAGVGYGVTKLTQWMTR